MELVHGVLKKEFVQNVIFSVNNSSSRHNHHDFHNFRVGEPKRKFIFIF